MSDDSERSTIYNSLTMEDYLRLTRAFDVLPEIRNNLVALNEHIESIQKSLEDIAYYFNTRIEMYEKEGKPF